MTGCAKGGWEFYILPSFTRSMYHLHTTLSNSDSFPKLAVCTVYCMSPYIHVHIYTNFEDTFVGPALGNNKQTMKAPRGSVNVYSGDTI